MHNIDSMLKFYGQMEKMIDEHDELSKLIAESRISKENDIDDEELSMVTGGVQSSMEHVRMIILKQLKTI